MAEHHDRAIRAVPAQRVPQLPGKNAAVRVITIAAAALQEVHFQRPSGHAWCRPAATSINAGRCGNLLHFTGQHGFQNS